METWKRAAVLGLLVGVLHTVLRLLVFDSVTTTPPGSRDGLVLQTLVMTVVSLAVLPGLAVAGGWRMGGDGALSRPQLAAVVAVGTGVAVVVGYPVITTVGVGVPLSETLQGWLIGTYVVNAIAPSVHAGVGFLAGLLLAARSATGA